MSELKPCKVCGGNVNWCHGIDDCKGCYLIVCESCKSVFDLSQCTGVGGYTLEKLRSCIAVIWNTRADIPDDLRADVLALCDLLMEGKHMTLDQLNRYLIALHVQAARISERLRGSELADELLGKYSGMENTDHGGAD